MDRKIVRPGQEVLEEDILETNKWTYEAIAAFMSMVVGTSAPLVEGFTPSVVSGTTVKIDSGSITAYAALDPTDYSTLGTDTRVVVKQGLFRSANYACPVVGGVDTNYIVQAQFSQVDDEDEILPYYDSSNPDIPWTGPNNSGTAETTRRANLCTVEVIAGSIPSGGWTGLYVITTPVGGGPPTWAKYSAAPFLDDILPNIPKAIQTGKYTLGTITGTDALTMSVAPKPAALVSGLTVVGRFVATNTGPMTLNLNAFGVRAVVSDLNEAMQAGQAVLGVVGVFTYDGTSWRLEGVGVPTMPTANNSRAPASTEFVKNALTNALGEDVLMFLVQY